MFFVFSNPMLRRKQTTLFAIAIAFNLLLIAATALDYVFASSQGEYFWLLRRITSFINFAGSPVIPLLLYRIFNEKRESVWIYVPLAANVLLCFSSLFVNSVFEISSRNTYNRGPFFFIPVIISVLYLLMLIFMPVKHHVRSKTIERYYLTAIIGLLALGMFLEIQFQYRFMDYTCSALGLIQYYLLLNIQRLQVDALTGAYNRLMYGKALESLDKSRTCIISLLDINNFKMVNDTCGHDAGDKYLISFVDILNRNLAGRTTLYRIGGDEFVLISRNIAPGDFDKILASAREELSYNRMEFACGTVEYHRGDGKLEELLKQADSLMYQNKTEMKKTAAYAQ